MVLTEEQVLAFCRGKLAHYKIPKSVAFVPQLPRNPAGKVLKPEVRKWFLPAAEAAGHSGKAEV